MQTDKLALKSYQDKNTYLYKGKVEVPPLEMVDDILVPVKCSPQSIIMNAKVNSFMESKKLKLNVEKCAFVPTYCILSLVSVGLANQSGKKNN